MKLQKKSREKFWEEPRTTPVATLGEVPGRSLGEVSKQTPEGIAGNVQEEYRQKV